MKFSLKRANGASNASANMIAKLSGNKRIYVLRRQLEDAVKRSKVR